MLSTGFHYKNNVNTTITLNVIPTHQHFLFFSFHFISTYRLLYSVNNNEIANIPIKRNSNFLPNSNVNTERIVVVQKRINAIHT